MTEIVKLIKVIPNRGLAQLTLKLCKTFVTIKLFMYKAYTDVWDREAE